MEKKGKQLGRKRKPQVPEEDDKQKESIMEEVSNISGKPIEAPVEKEKSTPSAGTKRAAKKQKTVNAKKSNVSSPSAPPPKKRKTEVKTDSSSEETETKPCKKGVPVPNLPGWRKEISIRKSGASAGKSDVYFYSPSGVKLRSRPEVSAYLKMEKINDVKIEDFDFTKKASKATGSKVSLENNTSKPKKQKGKIVKKKPQKKSKPVSTKKPRSEKSADVPSPADTEENDTDGKSNTNKVIIKILESKPKKSRK